VSEVKSDNRFKRYFKETRAEVRKVHWPTRKEARGLTTVVLVITIAMTIMLGIIISPLATTFSRALLVTHDPIVTAVTAVLAVAGVIALVIVLRRQ
jgi:preprotein translocase SecE subunit